MCDAAARYSRDLSPAVSVDSGHDCRPPVCGMQSPWRGRPPVAWSSVCCRRRLNQQRCRQLSATKQMALGRRRIHLRRRARPTGAAGSPAATAGVSLLRDLRRAAGVSPQTTVWCRRCQLTPLITDHRPATTAHRPGNGPGAGGLPAAGTVCSSTHCT